MANVFEDGKGDGRQSDDTEMRPSRFRPQYRALADEEKALHDAIKEKAVEMEALFESVRDIRKYGPMGLVPATVGRYVSLGMTELELAVMWAIKGLTS
jgi:hypothetical protein